jgi:serine/threonine-protein kinase
MSAADDAVPALSPGAVFHGAYEVVRCIQTGGMGAVYEVVQRSTRRRRALKVMLPGAVTDADMRARFRREATVAAAIESEHVVETVDAGVDEATGLPFLVMELLRGEDLRAVLEARGRLAPVEALTIAHQVGLALDRTHVAGVVHRDLKPSNLFLVARDDGSLCVKMLDFGVAKIVEEGSMSDGTRSVGSPLYMSPEQIRGDRGIDARADLYALGHLVFTMLAGHAYWVEERRATGGVYPFLMAVMRGPTETASGRAHKAGVALPPPFDVWFARATALDPKARFESAARLTEALARALGLPPPSALAASSLLASASEVDDAPLPALAPPPAPLAADAPRDAATTRVEGPPRPARTRRRLAPPLVGLGLLALGAALLAWPRGPAPARLEPLDVEPSRWAPPPLAPTPAPTSTAAAAPSSDPAPRAAPPRAVSAPPVTTRPATRTGSPPKDPLDEY